MKKSKSAFTFILIITFISFCGTVVQAQTTSVMVFMLPEKEYPLELWVYNIEHDTYEFREKLDLDSKGRVNFQIPDKPNLYQIKLGNNGIEFINDGDSMIGITVDMKTNVFSPISVNGSAATDHYIDYLLKVTELQKKYLFPLEPKMKAALKSKDQNRIDAVEQEHQENLKIFTSLLAEDIQSMGSSLAVFAVIRTLDFNKYLGFIETIAEKFVNDRQDTAFSMKLQQMIQETKKIQIGETAPEFKLKTNDGNEVLQLSDFRGGVTLVDFWASWCLPCIKENIEYQELFDKFNTKGFNIWAISVDTKEQNWKQSINKYKFSWVQSRLENDHVKSLYKIVSIPANFLLDENGKIIARNVTAKELSNLLPEIYK